jgi:hypothetical protein
LIKLHIATLDNPFNRVSDQIEFLKRLTINSKVSLSVSKRLKKNCLNLIFENINDDAKKTIKTFCEQNNKKVLVIMTEHIDYIKDHIRFHGEEISLSSEYMPPWTKTQRLLGLISLKKHIRCLLTLGEFPLLFSFKEIM